MARTKASKNAAPDEGTKPPPKRKQIPQRAAQIQAPQADDPDARDTAQVGTNEAEPAAHAPALPDAASSEPVEPEVEQVTAAQHINGNGTPLPANDPAPELEAEDASNHSCADPEDDTLIVKVAARKDGKGGGRVLWMGQLANGARVALTPAWVRENFKEWFVAERVAAAPSSGRLGAFAHVPIGCSTKGASDAVDASSAADTVMANEAASTDTVLRFQSGTEKAGDH